MPAKPAMHVGSCSMGYELIPTTIRIVPPITCSLHTAARSRRVAQEALGRTAYLQFSVRTLDAIRAVIVTIPGRSRFLTLPACWTASLPFEWMSQTLTLSTNIFTTTPRWMCWLGTSGAWTAPCQTVEKWLWCAVLVPTLKVLMVGSLTYYAALAGDKPYIMPPGACKATCKESMGTWNPIGKKSLQLDAQGRRGTRLLVG